MADAFETEREALEYLAANRELLSRPVDKILDDPNIGPVRDTIRAELAATIRPLIEARRNAGAARLT